MRPRDYLETIHIQKRYFTAPARLAHAIAHQHVILGIGIGEN
jgi:hypothetical protein